MKLIPPSKACLTSAVEVHRREIERGAAALTLAVIVVAAGILAREEPARQRAPDHQPDPFRPQHRHDLALQIAPGDGVVGLERGEALETEPLGNAKRLHDLPRGPVAHADIADAARADHVIERAQRLFDRRRRVPAMELIEIDMIGPQPLQASVDLVHEVVS